MKKVIFSLFALAFSAGAFAQAVILEDTVTYNKNSGCMPKNGIAQIVDGPIANNSSSAIALKWTLTNVDLPAGWYISGICDNNTCKDSSQIKGNPGPYNFSIPANSQMNISVDVKAYPGSADGIGYVTVNTPVGDIVFKFATCPQSTSNLDFSNFVNIYPNPANNYINIALNDKNIANITVMNVVGRKLAKFEVDADRSPIRVPLDNIVTGVYLLQFTDAKGKVLGVKRVTKQ